MYKEEKEIWTKFACAALNALVSDGQFENDVVYDCNLAVDYADRMLYLYKEKFENC